MKAMVWSDIGVLFIFIGLGVMIAGAIKNNGYLVLLGFLIFMVCPMIAFRLGAK